MSRAVRRSSHLALLTGLAVALSVAVAPAAPAASSSPVRAGSVPLSSAMADAAAALPAEAPFGAFVHFDGGDAQTRAAVLADHGLEVTSDFASVDVSYAVGTLGALLGLRAQPGVTYLEADRELEYFGDTATWATGARVARTEVGSGPYSVGGQVLDGTGVGVAVVDSGIDGTHPDLAARVGKSYKVVCSTPFLISTRTGLCFGPTAFVETPMSDNTGGHGTHVAGIAVGDGTASNGTYEGVAPGATLFSYGVGEAISILYNAEAFNHIIENHGLLKPTIRVVNNSYGDRAGTPYDPASVFSKLTRELVAKGVSVVFAAGNGDANGDGGTGADDRLSSMAKDPTPGVITAANYDDGGRASRNGTLNSSSSRGHATRPETYPDLSAPGTSITSTCNAALPVCRLEFVPTLGWAPYYATIGGTSMASPHVAGATALLYQAQPDLTPAQVEDVLLDTAHPFGFGATYVDDPQNAGSKTSYDKGAGLLDVPAALDALGVDADGRTAAAEPSVAITAPGEGADNDGTTALEVSGSAYDGVPAPVTPEERVLADGDGGDLPAPAPGAADLASLSVLEHDDGIDVTIGLRDLEDAGLTSTTLRLYQNLGGAARVTSVVVTGTSATAAAYNATTNNVLAKDIVRNVGESSVTLTLPFTHTGGGQDTSLGNPGPGSLATNVRVLSFVGSAVDQLPGGVGQAGTLQPEFGAPYEVLRPGSVEPPTATVTVAVDDGEEQPAVLSGSSPHYGFTSSVPTAALSDGPHVLQARLYLDGVLASTDTTTFTVTRPQIVTSSVGIVAPADGATVHRGVVDVTGSSATDAPDDTERSVRVTVTGSESTQVVQAIGTSSWTAPVDFGALPAGTYQLTAELVLDGVVAATDRRSVVVPEPAVLVSCAPQALKFWQDEYSGSHKAVFTATERDALAAKAAELSDGYFGNGGGVVTALYVKGKISGELAAARQFAVLLLDLAGGQLSADYSRQIGLSGSEQLDPGTYDTARLGATVGSASAWVRAQLPSGDLAGAESVAGSIARGRGLVC